MSATSSPDSGPLDPIPSASRPRTNALPRGRILRGRNAFKRVNDLGSRKAAPHLVLNYLPTAGDSRAAFIVPKRIGSAVERNRVRRRLKEAFRRLRSRLAPDVITIWIARHGIAEMDYYGIAREMTGLLDKAKLWQNGPLPSRLGSEVVQKPSEDQSDVGF